MSVSWKRNIRVESLIHKRLLTTIEGTSDPVEKKESEEALQRLVLSWKRDEDPRDKVEYSKERIQYLCHADGSDKLGKPYRRWAPLFSKTQH
ncbi:hypothetical protein JCM33374_g2057 [Metschnikowia sp. JCM 33374]|nr:hypothetical protein JCM33374_g2057 [Metschnikowia sp. JCM 33374]